MTIFRYLIFFSLTLGLFSGCDRCGKTSKTWKDDAVTLTEDFKKVAQEISNHSGLFNSLKDDSGDFYLDSDFVDKMTPESRDAVPLLRQWFQKSSDKEGGRSYISFKGETITVNFKSSSDKSLSYEGYLYYSKTGIRPNFTKDWKPEVELKDSLDLGDNWYYILSRCDGCVD